MSDLETRSAALERALVIGGAHLPPDAVERARRAVERGRERAAAAEGLAGASCVIALAGATGSGKSSLFNAFAGLTVAEVGARRPTTAAPSAVVWGDMPDRLLDWLDVPLRHRTRRDSLLDARDQDPLHGLVLLDLPDHDSTAVANRLQVDRLVGLVDLLVWVVDPQKYADAALHDHYLRPLAGHQELVLVVLNQVDTLDAASADACEADLRRVLAADGLDRVHVLRTSARTGEGVDVLRDVVTGAVAARSAAQRRTSADLAVVTAELRGHVGGREPDLASVDGADELIDVLATAAGVPTVLDAVYAQERRRGRQLTGWPLTRWATRLRPDPLARLRLGGEQLTGRGAGGADEGPDAVLRRLARTSLAQPTPAQRAQVALAARRVADRAATGLPERWADGVRAALAPATDDVTGALSDALDQAMLTVPLERRAPRWQRAVSVVQVLLAVVAVLGLVWTLGWAGAGWLGLPLPAPPTVGVEPLDVPVPLVLLVLGLVAGLGLSAACAPGVRAGARRRRQRVRTAMRAVVAAVARGRLLDAVAGVLAAHRTTREALEEAAPATGGAAVRGAARRGRAGGSR